jgi:simple sugar transport system permease protein
VRYGTIITGSTLAGIAGAALAIELGIFQQNLTNGQGFIAVALVYFGAWRPIGVLGGAMLYGLVAALILQWKTLGIIPQGASDIAAMAPALLTILALVIVGQRQRAPTALTKPYERGS